MSAGRPGRVDIGPAEAILREIVRERHQEAERLGGGSSYDEAIARRDEALLALAALGAA
jgi:hypothetical protein